MPGNIPLAAMSTWWWQNQFCCRDADLVIGHNRTLAGTRAKFACKVMDGFNQISTWIAPAEEIGTGMFLFHTYTEREYLKNLKSIPAETIEGWRGRTGVDGASSCWQKPLLVPEFRYLHKTSRYWTFWVKN